MWYPLPLCGDIGTYMQVDNEGEKSGNGLVQVMHILVNLNVNPISN